jgi:hypothetical protein
VSVFLEIADYYAVADAAFAAVEQKAFQNDEDLAFDQARIARQHNDQAYFLYLFSRFEAAVNTASQTLLAQQRASTVAWPERRIWQAWARVQVREIAFLSKVEVLTDKGGQDYATIKDYYEGRNTIAHGGVWEAQFFIPNVALTMNDLLQRFATG